MSVDKQFRNELKSMLSSNKQNNQSFDKESKHVSWVTVEKEDNKPKKHTRSTPFPRRKSSKDLDLKPISLSFGEENESKEDIDSNSTKKRKIEINEGNLKKKISKLNSGWVEVDISSPVESSDSEVSSEDVIVSEIDPEGVIAKEILKEIKRNKINVNDSFQNETFTSEMDQIELYNTSDFSSDILENYNSESSSDEELFQVPKIVKNAKKFKNRCRIVEIKKSLNTYFPETTNNNDTTIICKKKSITNEKEVKLRNKMLKTNKKIILETENFSEDNSSTDEEFLLDDSNNTKEFVSISPQKNIMSNETIKFHITRDCSILLLNRKTKLYFCGKVEMSVLSGSIKILGYTFEEGSKNINVYSPKGHGYLCISTVKTSNKNLNINISTKDVCVIALKNIENNNINCVINHTFQQLFPKVSRAYEERQLSLLEMRLQCYFETNPIDWPILEVDEKWDDLIGSFDVSKKLSLMVCGGKGVGKSTFLRYVTNLLLSKVEKVVYIDLDPGQPEFTISGCLSICLIDEPLLGPNYTHLKKPEKCYFLGETNISHCFNQYISAVKDLLTYYNKEIDPSIPCVINYMGFTKTLGIDLIASIIPIIKPTVLVQMESEDPKHNFPSLLDTSFIEKHSKSLPVEVNIENLNYDLKVVKSVCTSKRTSEFEPRILRNMCIASYFGSMFTNGDEVIASEAPYCANLSSLKLQHTDSTTENLLPVINGNLVALCENSVSNCLGFGIVRGIDVTSDKIYIITPENTDIMKRVNTIAMGVIGLPPTFYTTEGHYEGSHPYICRTVRHATTSTPKRAYRACQYLLTNK